MSDTFAMQGFNNSQSAYNFDHISPVAVPSVKETRFQYPYSRISFVATHLVVKESVPDIFRHSRCNQNVVLTFFAPLSSDTIVEHVSAILN